MPVFVELDTTGEHILIRAEWRYKELCKTIPGTSWNKAEDAWQFPTSWSGCLSLRSTFKTDLEIGPRLAEWAAHERAIRIDPANALRDALRLDPDVADDLFPHQRVGVQFLATARQALLADEPGLGKTAQAIRALAELQKRGEVPFPALVVCPSTLKRNWEREFAKWWPGVRVQVIAGTATQRRKQFDTYLNPKEGEPKPHVIVINWDSLRSHSRLAPYGSIAFTRCPEHGGEDESISAARCEVHERELNKIPFKAVIADEIHRSKDPKAKQTRALWSASGDADIRFALTGTPIAQNAADLWSILHWLNEKEWPSKTKWVERMINTMMNAFGGLMILGIKPQMYDEFQAALEPRMRRMLKEAVLPDLPPVLFERRDVTMSVKQRKAYEQLRDHMIAELDDGTYLMATSPLTQMTRLLQMSNAYAEITTLPSGETKAILSDPSAKIDALMEDISNGDFGEDSVAITSVSRQLIELLSARLTKAGIPHGMITGAIPLDERQQHIDDFQNGRTKFILFTAAAGGVGVTLTAARWLVRLQRPWSLVDDKQVQDRVHRIGSEVHDSIVVVDYVTENTVEERVMEVLDAKGIGFEEIVRDKDKLRDLLVADKGTK